MTAATEQTLETPILDLLQPLPEPDKGAATMPPKQWFGLSG
jgi:hypothetical protein